jgi:hypothetical protein
LRSTATRSIARARFGTVDGDRSQGSVHTFARAGGDRNEIAKLTASDGAAFDQFGASVAIDGDTIVAGAPRDDVPPDATPSRDHSAYAFARTGVAVRAEAAKLTAADGAAGDRLGTSVAIDGDTIAAGALLDDIGANSDQGSTSVFVAAADADDDGVPDATDNCPNDPNPRPSRCRR